jgi:electron transport complex protein RnfC
VISEKKLLFYKEVKVAIFRLRGVHVKHCKNTAKMSAVRIPVPKTVNVPMSMHIGAPAKPIVKVGDEVKVGQLIGEAGAGLSAPVYSSVSGKVKKIDEMLNIAGGQIQTILIETDGLQIVDESIKPYEVSTREEFLDALSKSGIVGLGGAGFPTLTKLRADISKIDTLLINGAECEPYITSDTRTMLDDADAVADGIMMVKKFLEIGQVIVGIEKNKPECISSMKKALSGIEGATVKALPSVYPQGGEKVLVYHTLGRVIKEGGLPLDCGVIVMNCTTIANISKFIRTGMPLVEKCVTVDGSAIKEPKNIIAPIGTPARDLVEFCGGFAEEPKKALYGGPMMGIALTDLSAPVL